MISEKALHFDSNTTLQRLEVWTQDRPDERKNYKSDCWQTKYIANVESFSHQLT